MWRRRAWERTYSFPVPHKKAAVCPSLLVLCLFKAARDTLISLLLLSSPSLNLPLSLPLLFYIILSSFLLFILALSLPSLHQPFLFFLVYRLNLRKPWQINRKMGSVSFSFIIVHLGIRTWSLYNTKAISQLYSVMKLGFDAYSPSIHFLGSVNVGWI